MGMYKKYGICCLVIFIYQLFIGIGVKVVNQYESECDGKVFDVVEMVYYYFIFENCLLYCDIFFDNDYIKEEMKFVYEICKIFGDDKIGIIVIVVWVFVYGGYLELVNVELKKVFMVEDICQLLVDIFGVIIEDDLQNNCYLML